MVTELSLFKRRKTQGLERSDHVIENIWPEVSTELLSSLSLTHSVTSVFMSPGLLGSGHKERAIIVLQLGFCSPVLEHVACKALFPSRS